MLRHVCGEMLRSCRTGGLVSGTGRGLCGVGGRQGVLHVQRPASVKDVQADRTKGRDY